jgi:hypothetical protein
MICPTAQVMLPGSPESAESLNDDGLIAAYCLIGGNVHAFLAMPRRDYDEEAGGLEELAEPIRGQISSSANVLSL